LSVAHHKHAGGASIPLNKTEQFSSSLHGANSQRLVLLHSKREIITGTAHWLDARDITMHHHLAINDPSDYTRLVRFILGKAIGLVACGGGALCCAHLGIYKALNQAGIKFDIFGGTSGGSAMAATFIQNMDPDDVERQTHDMFVTQKALGRYNLPIFSLLDHKNFDRQLQRLFGGIKIEDCWFPYFAVVADLSSGNATCIRQGSLWQAIRASSSLPALLPPFYTNDGHMLVDGGLIDNVPISVMNDLKDGPNVVISFENTNQELFAVDYHKIPSRSGLMGQMLATKDRKKLDKTPKLVETLMRSLLANRQDFQANLGHGDVVMSPDLPDHIGIMDWHESANLMDIAYEWTGGEIHRLRKINDPAVACIDTILKNQTLNKR